MDVAKYKHGFSTNLKAGRIKNADATLILLHQMGGVAHRRDLRTALQTWRPGFNFTYLFNGTTTGGYGFVGTNVKSTHNKVYDNAASFRANRAVYVKRRTYWYRQSHGTYALTLEGVARLKELTDQLV